LCLARGARRTSREKGRATHCGQGHLQQH
jgi:hypothetical protein